MRGPVVVMLVVALLLACGGSAPDWKGTKLDAPRPVQDFTLTDQDGQPFRFSDHRGQVVLLFFGYTFCPDVCPVTLGTWQRVHEGLGDDAQDVTFLFITVDPERDTPERLRAHVEVFNEEFFGLTGAPDQLQSVYDQFGVFSEKDANTTSAAGYLVSHTASAFVVDRTGHWRLRHSFGTSSEDIVHDLEVLLNE